MNPYSGSYDITDQGERWNPFLNLSRLDLVEIRGLKVFRNFMIDTREVTPSLFTI